MMRAWTRGETYQHLVVTFDLAARRRPDLFEPYLIRLAGADESEQMTIMREALRATFATRYPNRFAQALTTDQ